MSFIKHFKDDRFGEIRITIREGQAWFLSEDICNLLGTRVRDIPAILDTDEWLKVKCDSIADVKSTTKETIILSESGYYSLVIRSRKPIAKPFRKWVTSVVLPSISANDAYMGAETIEKLLADPDLIIGLATQLKESNNKIQGLKVQAHRNAPKVKVFDDIVNAGGVQHLSTLGKVLTGHPHKFTQQLVNDKILFRRNRVLLPYAQYDKKYFMVKEYYHEPSFTLRVHTYVTPEGVAWLAKKYGESA